MTEDPARKALVLPLSPLPTCGTRAELPTMTGHSGVEVVCARHRHDDPHHAGVVQLYVGRSRVSGVITWEAP